MSIDNVFFSESEPGVIKSNSDKIKSILSEDDLDAQSLQECVEQREQTILEFLRQEQKPDKQLLQELIRTNQELTELVNSLKSEQQKVLVSFLRTRKNVKKYQ